MEREDFWGCQLTKSAPEHTWSVEGESEVDVDHRLMVVQACLGSKRAAEKVNVVEVTAADHEGKKVTCPIACLHEGFLTCQVNLTFEPPVSFKLVEGSGPVGLTGTYMQALSESIMDEESDDEASLEEVPKLVKLDKKRPLETPKGLPSKKAKVKADNARDEESDEDSEEEAEQKNSKVEKVKRESKGLLEDIDESGSDSDDEDDDDYEEGEDGEDEDESSEDESGEESSEDELTSKLTAEKANKGGTKEKKPLINGADKKAVHKDTEKKGAPKDINSIKQMLLKSPSLPKTVGKFKNFMKSYKMTEEKPVQDLWEWLQKNKK